MQYFTLFIVWLSLFTGSPEAVLTPEQPENKKIEKALKETLQSEDYYLIPLVINGDSVVEQPNTGNRGRFYRITVANENRGTLYTGSAKGRYDWFEFLVIFNRENLIEKLVILVYNSDHGFEIMNKNWLKQFEGTSGCNLSYGNEIDAITGATISGNSLTSAITELCETLKTINEPNN